MVVSNNDGVNRIRHWMEDWRNDTELLKLGQRFAPMSFMDLIVLKVKFAHLKEIISSRQKIKIFYEQELGCLEGLTIFKDRPDTESVPQNFVVCCGGRDRLIDFLTSHGVAVQKPYLPLHKMEALKGIMEEKFPVSQWYASTALHLPLYSFMSQDKVQNVIEHCQSFLREGYT